MKKWTGDSNSVPVLSASAGAYWCREQGEEMDTIPATRGRTPGWEMGKRQLHPGSSSLSGCPDAHAPRSCLLVTVSVSLGHIPGPGTRIPVTARPHPGAMVENRTQPGPCGTVHMPPGALQANPGSQARGHLLCLLALGEPCLPEQQGPLEGQSPAGFLE